MELSTTVQAGDALFQNLVTYLFSPLFQLVVAVTIVYFLYGVLMFIVNFNDPEKKETGKRHMVYGLIGLLIILSINGILVTLSKAVGGIFQY